MHVCLKQEHWGYSVLTGPQTDLPADDAPQRVAGHAAVDGVVNVDTELIAGERREHQGAVGHLVAQAGHSGQGTAVLLGPVDGWVGATSRLTLQAPSRAVGDINARWRLQHEHRPLTVHGPRNRTCNKGSLLKFQVDLKIVYHLIPNLDSSVA